MPVPRTATVAPPRPWSVWELVTRPRSWRTWATTTWAPRRRSERIVPHTRSAMAPPTVLGNFILGVVTNSASRPKGAQGASAPPGPPSKQPPDRQSSQPGGAAILIERRILLHHVGRGHRGRLTGRVRGGEPELAGQSG